MPLASSVSTFHTFCKIRFVSLTKKVKNKETLSRLPVATAILLFMEQSAQDTLGYAASIPGFKLCVT